MRVPIPFASGSSIRVSKETEGWYSVTKFRARTMRNQSHELSSSIDARYSRVHEPTIGALLENKSGKYSGGHIFVWGDSTCFDDHQGKNAKKELAQLTAELYPLDFESLTHVRHFVSNLSREELLNLVTTPNSINRLVSKLATEKAACRDCESTKFGKPSHISRAKLHSRQDLPHCLPLLTRLLHCVQEGLCDSLKELAQSLH